jgi:peptide/nickel transport system permease protein
MSDMPQLAAGLNPSLGTGRLWLLHKLLAFWSHHGVVRLLVRRAAAMVVLSFGISLVAFVLTHLVPGDPVVANLGLRAASNPEVRAAYMARYGLDKPLPVQYEVYMGNLLHGDLGRSQLTRRPVTIDLQHFVPASIELGLLAMLIATVVGLPLGLVAAVRRGSVLDSGLNVVSLFGISTPSFWVGLIALFMFSFVLDLVPGSGRLSAGALPPPTVTGMYTTDSLLAGDLATFGDALHHLLLPAFVIAVSLFGVLQRFTRSAVLEVINNDYITAARAKGLPGAWILLRYTLRAALTPILTLSGLEFANLMTGAVLVETVFAFPGIGRYAAQSALNLDIAAITGVSIFVAIVYVATNFVVDVLYALIDPRVRLA